MSPPMPASLGDFTATRRMLPITLLAVLIGAAAALVAFALLRLIGFFTNVFYYQRLDTAFVSPAGSSLGVAMALVPVAGALVIGLMARYGSERIRGHGIPEALEAGRRAARRHRSRCREPRAGAARRATRSRRHRRA